MTIRNAVHRGFDLLRKATIAVIFLSKYYLLRSRIGNWLYSAVKDWRYDTGFRDAPVDFFRTAAVDPDRITQKINQNSFGYQYTQMGRIETGEFPSASVQFEHYYVYTSLYEHFVNGREWEETAYYTVAFDQVDATDLGWSQIPDYEALDEFFEGLDELYESIETRGYQPSSAFKTEASGIGKYALDPIRAHDEVFIDIGRDGELLLTDGRHRVAIARIQGLDEIPVRILARHQQWCRFRQDLFDVIRSNGLARETTKYPIFHPELRHLESRYEPDALADRIESAVDPAEGPIIEYDPGVSAAVLHELAVRGYDVIAIVRDDDQKRFIEWYADFANVDINTRQLSRLDETPDSETMIALNPVDREAVQACLERSDIRRLITTDSASYQEQLGERIEIVDVSNLH